jgi:hypothetical protein
MRFPELHARDRDGRSVRLPDDIGPDPTLLLVSFSPQLTPDVETWFPLAADLAGEPPDVWCYDLLVLPEFPDGVEVSLADELHADGGRLERGERTRSLVAHTDLSAFGRALVLEGFDRVYALVLHEGRVRWRAFGPLTTPLERRLRARLDDFDDESVDSVVS